MNKERGLLNLCAVTLKARNICPLLLKDISELLAQPEQEVYAKGYAEAMKQQVYEAYESGRKSALSKDWDKERDVMSEAWYLPDSKQEPIAWGVYDPDSDMLISIYGYKEKPDKVLKDRFKWVKLYALPQKREPLSDKEITKNTPKLIHIGERLAFHAGVRFSERHHIIGVNDDT